jgi:O-antigen/teichoic acid export membrane protein
MEVVLTIIGHPLRKSCMFNVKSVLAEKGDFRSRQFLQDPLYKNSLFIFLNSIASTGFGFLFWVIAAKLCSPQDIGIATALISSQSLLILLSRFGLDSSIIRFFPEMDKSKVFSTSVIVTNISVAILGMTYLSTVDLFSPQLSFLKATSNSLAFIVFLMASSAASLAGISFIAMRKAEYSFVQNVLIGSRVIFIFPLAFLGAMGIFSAVGISFIIALLISATSLFRQKVRPCLEIDRRFLRDAFRFSSGNYISSLLSTAPNQLLPLMILSTLGAKETAHYYIAATVVSPLFMVPGAVSMSLFVEGSHGESLRKNAMKSLALTLSILLPLIGVFYFFGGYFLDLVGKSYVEGFAMLRALAFSSVFVAIYQIYFSVKMVHKDVRGLIFLSSLAFVSIIGLSYAFMNVSGILGIGYAWIVGYGLCSLIVVGLAMRAGWR